MANWAFFAQKGAFMDFLPIKRAIVSVTDKSGVVELASFLVDQGAQIVSTGGTMRALSDAGVPVTPVSDVTKFPEILGGRVKTLHPAIHAGVLADKDNPDHLATLAEHGLEPFDLVLVNLYDFASAKAKGLDLRGLIEQIDIGGPTLLRASAKNLHSVAVVPDPAEYDRLRQEMQANGGKVGLEFRLEMAAKTFDLVSRYDRMISDTLASAL
jgi:phosphoribosylaminoimidazolecarboxamide formyltransferase/IMP cyclohydrolase